MIPRSVFVEFVSVLNVKNIKQITSSESWFSASIGDVKKIFPVSPKAQYGDNVWNDVIEEQTKIEKRILAGKLKKRSLFVSYLVASRIACAMNIESMRDWSKKHKEIFSAYNLPIPSAPHLTYKESGWEGWGDFLKTGRTQDYEFLTYEEAKKIIEILGIKTTTQFKEFINSPLANPKFPKRPDHVYKDVWTSWIDFLSSKFVTYDQAREALRPLKMCSEGDFRTLGKHGLRPEGIPSHPSVFYAREFISWAHFLGWEDEIERDIYSSSEQKKALFG